MFITIGVTLILCSFFCFFIDKILPFIVWMPSVLFMIDVTGVMLIMVGLMTLLGRIYAVRAHLLIDLPKHGETINIHQRRGGRARLERGKLLPLEHIKGAKNKLFKDAGGSILLAGHDIRLTHETINHTIPPWSADWVHRIKEKYGTEKIGDLKKLYDKLKTVEEYRDLEHIKELQPLMVDPKKKKMIYLTPLDDIRNMAEALYDGTSANIRDYYDFEESAAPYDMDSFVTHQFAHRTWQFNTYSKMGGIDWSKVVIPFSIILIIGAIAYQIFGSG